jgi:diguanylate cyclase (GGDEF)-like protein/PAS domain S-box-containing protein
MTDSANESAANRALSSLSRAQLETILDASPLGMAITRYYDGVIVYVNSTLADWAEISVDEMIGTPAINYYCDMDALSAAVEVLKDGRPVNNYEMRMKGTDGAYLWRQVNMVALWLDDERIILSWYNDINELLKARQELIHLAKHDALTGLANIAHFGEYLIEAAESAAANTAVASLLYLDLDDFKKVNDRYGHQFGNRVLKMVVDRIRLCIDDNDFAARIGGDEFALIVESTDNDVQAALDKAEQILAMVREPYSIDGRNASLSISIGVTHFDGKSHCADEIVTQADNAMYRAKHGGKNRICVHSSANDG